MISDEVPEIVRNCNRILVMADGRIVREVNTVDITEDKLFDLVSSNSKIVKDKDHDWND